MEHSVWILTIMCYTSALKKRIKEMANDECYGCQVDHPSQTQHTCLMCSEEEHVDMYFDKSLNLLNEDEISEQLRTELDSRSLAVNRRREYEETVCDSKWRDENLKTEEWTEKLYEDVHKSCKLEDRMSVQSEMEYPCY